MDAENPSTAAALPDGYAAMDSSAQSGVLAAQEQVFSRRVRLVYADRSSARRPVHPSILPVVAAGESGKQEWRALALPSGRTLRDRLDAGLPPTPELTRSILRCLLDGLSACARTKQCHAALGAEAIWIAEDGEVLLDGPFAPEGAVRAAPPPDDDIYAAPETRRGGRRDLRSNMFAAAMVVLEAHLGTDHLRRQRRLAEHHGHWHPQRLVEELVPVDVKLAAVVEEMLQGDPAARPSPLTALRLWRGRPNPPARWLGGNRLLIGLYAGAAAALLLAGALLWTKPKAQPAGPTPEPVPQEQAPAHEPENRGEWISAEDTAYAALRQLHGAPPEDVYAGYRDFLQRFPQTHRRAEVLKRLDEARRRYRAQARAEWERAREAAERLQRVGRWGEAWAVVDGFPSRFASSEWGQLAETFKRERVAELGLQEARLESAVARAGQAGDHEKALALLAQAGQTGVAWVDSRRERLAQSCRAHLAGGATEDTSTPATAEDGPPAFDMALLEASAFAAAGRGRVEEILAEVQQRRQDPAYGHYHPELSRLAEDLTAIARFEQRAAERLQELSGRVATITTTDGRSLTGEIQRVNDQDLEIRIVNAAVAVRLDKITPRTRATIGTRRLDGQSDAEHARVLADAGVYLLSHNAFRLARDYLARAAAAGFDKTRSRHLLNLAARLEERQRR